MATMINKIEYVTPAEAAEIIGVSVRRVHQYCKKERLGFRVGGRYLIAKKEAEKFEPNPPGRPVERKSSHRG